MMQLRWRRTGSKEDTQDAAKGCPTMWRAALKCVVEKKFECPRRAVCSMLQATIVAHARQAQQY